MRTLVLTLTTLNPLTISPDIVARSRSVRWNCIVEDSHLMVDVFLFPRGLYATYP